MSRPPDWDAVVIGAGVAGVSLASHLAVSPWRRRRVLLLDRRTDPLAQRAWAFWASHPAWPTAPSPGPGPPPPSTPPEVRAGSDWLRTGTASSGDAI